MLAEQQDAIHDAIASAHMQAEAFNRIVLAYVELDRANRAVKNAPARIGPVGLREDRCDGGLNLS